MPAPSRARVRLAIASVKDLRFAVETSGAGDPGTGGKPGSAKSVILITCVVEKGKPLASPA
jgi:hypothetical protein